MPSDVPSDELLVLRSQLGDRQALNDLVDRLHPPVHRFLRTIAGDEDVADDLAHETWLRALRTLARLREPASIRPWLFTIARRTANDRLRALYRHRAVVDDRLGADGDHQADDGAFDELARAVDRLHVTTLVVRLDLELRELVDLFYLEQFSVDEVAAIVGVPSGTVKSRLHRARRRLAELDRPGGHRTPADPIGRPPRTAPPTSTDDTEPEDRP